MGVEQQLVASGRIPLEMRLWKFVNPCGARGLMCAGPDNQAYKQFIRDELEKITFGPKLNVTVYFRGDLHCPIEDVIYTFLRCKLMHEGSLPKDIRLTDPVVGDGKPFGKSPDGTPYDGKLSNELVLEDVLGFPIGWIWNLVRVVAEAPENQSEFPDGVYPVPEGYSVKAGLVLNYPDEHPERFPPNASKLTAGRTEH